MILSAQETYQEREKINLVLKEFEAKTDIYSRFNKKNKLQEEAPLTRFLVQIEAEMLNLTPRQQNCYNCTLPATKIDHNDTAS